MCTIWEYIINWNEIMKSLMFLFGTKPLMVVRTFLSRDTHQQDLLTLCDMEDEFQCGEGQNYTFRRSMGKIALVGC